MIPYVVVPSVELGSLRIDAFVALGLCAALVAIELAAQRGPATGIDADSMRAFAIWVLVPTLVGARVFDAFAEHLDAITRDPLQLLDVFGGLSLCGGVVGALLGALAWRQTVGQPVLPYLDAFMSVAPVPWAIARLGAALTHETPGNPSTHANPLAVAYPSGPRWDISVLGLLIALLLCAIVGSMWRTPRPVGTYVATVALAFAPVRFLIEYVSDAPRYGGATRLGSFTQDQLGCALLVALGAVALHEVRESRGRLRREADRA